MAKKWDRLAGETGEEVPSSRWTRMLKLGGLGMKVSASAVAGKVARAVVPRSKAAKQTAAENQRKRNAERVVKVLGQLKGASMKIGQILSSDPDLVPAEYMDILGTLQRNAPPMTYNTVKSQIETALDRPIEDIFSFFDPEPVGAASIGQVHRGTLQDGRDVAVKVQYPGMVATLDSDLKNLGSLLGFGRALVDKRRLDEYLEECRKAIIDEADYIKEAANLRHFFEVFQDREGVRSPEPVEEFTRQNVLMMEYIEGVKLDEALETMTAEERTPILHLWVYNYAWMFHELLELHADPHPGNFLLDPDGNLVILDFGCVKPIPAAFADGILDVLDSCWQGDHVRAAECYKRMGFGKDGADDAIFDPELLRAYHQLILEPFITDAAWDFGAWRPRADIQRFVFKNPRFIKLVPPADALMYFRVLSGIKGLLGKVGGSVNVYRMAIESARNRGRLTAEPKLDELKAESSASLRN